MEFCHLAIKLGYNFQSKIINYLLFCFAFLCAWRSTGLRDDLIFLLEEDLSSINLCSLHCEMRNCEQLLGSLGLFAHRVGSLDELNQALSDHGPESCKGFPRITIKQKPGQQTAVERNNIKVASFSGLFIVVL